MAAADVTDLDCVLALLRHGADASLRDVACSNAGGFALKRGSGPTTDIGVVLLAARDRGPANAIDAYEALDAYRRTKKYLQSLKVTKALLEVDVDTKDPRQMSLNDVLNSPERADGDTTWRWRLKPRDTSSVSWVWGST